jgi:hypothetical protein
MKFAQLYEAKDVHDTQITHGKKSVVASIRHVVTLVPKRKVVLGTKYVIGVAIANVNRLLAIRFCAYGITKAAITMYAFHMYTFSSTLRT